jgi:tRNA threonylcarbamoyladenosine biosynthesis protein TsaE
MQHFTAHLHDEEGTAALGAALARACCPAWRSTCTATWAPARPPSRALLHAAGHTGTVKSPTYTLSEPYSIQLDGRAVSVIHFDLYRMGSPKNSSTPASAKTSTATTSASSNGRKRPTACCRRRT